MDSKKEKKHKYYEIKVSIRDTHPPVWRRYKYQKEYLSMN